MAVHNSDVAEIFNRIADLLEIKGKNPFRIRAYRNAARTVGGLSRNITDLVEQEKDLGDLPGIGKSLAKKIKTIVETGTHPLLEKLEKQLPPGLPDLMRIQGLGPKKVKTLYKKLKIGSIADLKSAAEGEEIRDIKGFGEKTETNILKELERIERQREKGKRIELVVAEQYAEPLVEYLKGEKDLKDIIVAGSYRRKKQTVGDLDILVTCKKSASIMERFVKYEEVENVISRGKTRSSVRLKSGLQVDLRVVAEVSFGAALHYFTGSKEHNIAVRKMGVKKNLKVNEYGVFRGKKRIAGKTERAVYQQVDLPYIEPELRENRGELEAAKKDSLPRLITLGDIRGDLHVHSKYTDGHYSMEEMAAAAKKKGYDYIAITDHSKHVTVAKGLDSRRLENQIREIDRLNEKLEGIRILKSIELDILEDGSLDLPDGILDKLDLVVCSIHYKFNLSREKQTERVIRAMDHPCFNIFGHPSGRLINEREPYDINLEKVMRAARDRGCYLELNAHPDRLDLDDIHCKMARDLGIKVAVSTDAHSTDDLDLMRFGIGQARRGWLESGDVLNTLSWEKLKEELKRD